MRNPEKREKAGPVADWLTKGLVLKTRAFVCECAKNALGARMMEHTVPEIAKGSAYREGLHEVRRILKCNAEACDNLALKKCNALPRSLSTPGGRVRACGILAPLLAVLFLEAFASRRTRVRGVTLPGVGASAAGTETDCSHRAGQAM